MLDYLVTSNVRRNLLRLLWQKGRKGTASELARQSGFAYAAVHKELKAMRQVGLARRGSKASANVYEANRNHPFATTLEQLLEADSKPVTSSRPENPALQKLLHHGLPLTGESGPTESVGLERLVAKGAAETHSDPTAARAFPVLLWRVRNLLDYDQLLEESRREGVKHTVGFMLELTGRLSGDDMLAGHARKFRDRRRRQNRAYFNSESTYGRRLAERRTPRLAREWGWLMNMGQDAFEDTFRKFQS